MVQIFIFAISPIILLVLLALFLRNPAVTQIPLNGPVIVEVERECSTAAGPCMTCLPDANGALNCATVTFGTCPGTQLMLETQQEMKVTRKRGEPKVEMVTLDAEALGVCEG